MEGRKMKIKIDIEDPMGEKPELVGLWIQGFGWVVGGVESGQMCFSGEIKSPTLERGIRSTFRAFLKRVRKWDPWKNDKTWKIRRKGHHG